MSFREYARRSGVSLKAIQDRIANGSITERAIVRTEGKWPRIDSEIADADFAQKHDVAQKVLGDLAGGLKSKKVKKPVKALSQDDNPEGLPDGPPTIAENLPQNCHEIATKLPETPQVVDNSGEKPLEKVSQKRPESVTKASEKGVLPDTKPPEVPKPKVEEREINGQKVDATVLPTYPEDKFDRYRDAKTSTEELRARKLELEVAEAEGRLLDADDVRKEIVKLVGETREAFLNLGPKLAPILVSITDPVEMENKLIESINETLHNLSRFENGVG